jgi:putative transposase
MQNKNRRRKYMANTYTKIYIQMVFWIHDNCLHESFRNELYAYMGGVLKAKKHKPLAIGGTTNHVHIFTGLNPSQAISDLVKDIKVSSSLFIKKKEFIKCRFNWQEGFGAFSYHESCISNVINYINNQKEHHRTKTFKEEYIELLKEFGIEYKEEYLL